VWSLVAEYAPDGLALFGGLIVVVCTLRDFSLEQSKQRDHSTRRRLAWLIAFGGLMSIIGAFLGSQQNGRFQRRRLSNTPVPGRRVPLRYQTINPIQVTPLQIVILAAIAGSIRMFPPITNCRPLPIRRLASAMP
jgi:hypothetical protein